MAWDLQAGNRDFSKHLSKWSHLVWQLLAQEERRQGGGKISTLTSAVVLVNIRNTPNPAINHSLSRAINMKIMLLIN